MSPAFQKTLTAEHAAPRILRNFFLSFIMLIAEHAAPRGAVVIDLFSRSAYRFEKAEHGQEKEGTHAGAFFL